MKKFYEIVIIVMALSFLIISCTDRKPFYKANGEEGVIEVVEGQNLKDIHDTFVKLNTQTFSMGRSTKILMGRNDDLEARALIKYHFEYYFRDYNRDSLEIESAKLCIHFDDYSPKYVEGNIEVYSIREDKNWSEYYSNWYNLSEKADSLGVWDMPGGDYENELLLSFPANSFADLDSTDENYAKFDANENLMNYVTTSIEDTLDEYSRGLIFIPDANVDSLLVIHTRENGENYTDEFTNSYIEVICKYKDEPDTVKVFAILDTYIYHDLSLGNSENDFDNASIPTTNIDKNYLKISTAIPYISLLKFDLPDSIEAFLPDSLQDELNGRVIKMKDIVVNKAVLNLRIKDCSDDREAAFALNYSDTDWLTNADDDSLVLNEYSYGVYSADSIYVNKTLKLTDTSFTRSLFQNMLLNYEEDDKKNNGVFLRFSSIIQPYRYIEFYSSEDADAYPYVELTYSILNTDIINKTVNLKLKKMER